jgi:two-component system, NarL family, sensor histidine kinase EvgS
MLHRLIGEDIDLIWAPGEELWPIKIDPAQVDQIMANLCVNARDAIVGTGKLTIETENVRITEDYCADHAGFTAGEYVLLAVSDDGTGMDQETLDNIFEPFFTTKEIGQGTGLGMSTVYGIIKQNKGFINVYSELDNGTTVRIYFPRDTETVLKAQHERISAKQMGQGETILLVEDEAPILRLGKRVLEDLGYQVLDAIAPDAALEIARTYAGTIDLLITDVVMPGMNGRQLARAVRDSYPAIKVLYMSGYTANAIAHHGVLDEGVHFMQKPFSKTDMAGKVRQALAG